MPWLAVGKLREPISYEPQRPPVLAVTWSWAAILGIEEFFPNRGGDEVPVTKNKEKSRFSGDIFYYCRKSIRVNLFLEMVPQRIARAAGPRENELTFLAAGE